MYSDTKSEELVLNIVASRNLKSFSKAYPGMQMDWFSTEDMIILVIIVQPVVSSWITLQSAMFDNWLVFLVDIAEGCSGLTPGVYLGACRTLQIYKLKMRYSAAHFGHVDQQFLVRDIGTRPSINHPLSRGRLRAIQRQ